MDERSERRNAAKSPKPASAWIHAVVLVTLVLCIGVILPACGRVGHKIGGLWCADDAPAILQPHGRGRAREAIEDLKVRCVGQSNTTDTTFDRPETRPAVTVCEMP